MWVLISAQAMACLGLLHLGVPADVGCSGISSGEAANLHLVVGFHLSVIEKAGTHFT